MKWFCLAEVMDGVSQGVGDCSAQKHKVNAALCKLIDRLVAERTRMHNGRRMVWHYRLAT
jgi:hypothetical protein